MSCGCNCNCPAQELAYGLEDLLAEDLPPHVEDTILALLNLPAVRPLLAQGTNSDPS